MRQGTTVIQRLFENIPNFFSREPYPIPAFYIVNTALAYDKGKVSIIVSDGRMRIESYCSYISSEIINLSSFTMITLEKYFYKKYPKIGLSFLWDSYTETTTKNLSASCLLEGTAYADKDGIYWNAFSSENYKFLMPIALSLVDNMEYMQTTINQIDQRLGTGKWVDYWGNILGISRHTSEILDDMSYKLRMRQQISYPKVNNIALNQIIQIDNGPKIILTDGSAPVRTPYSNVPLYTTSTTGTININTVAGSNLIWVANNSGQPYVLTGSVSVGDRIKCDNYIKGDTQIIRRLMTLVGGERWYYIISKPALQSTFVGSPVLASTFAIGNVSLLPIVATAMGTANVSTVNGTSTMTVIEDENNPAQGFFPPLYADPNPITYEGKTLKTILPTVHEFPSNLSTSNQVLFQIEYNAGTTAVREGAYPLVGVQTSLSDAKIYTLPYGYGSQQDNTVFSIGPTTGNRIINVTINTEGGLNPLTQNMYEKVILLLNKWKPAGVSFEIKIV